jgi:hypothetical protein|tara:strand:- start:1335 stop:1565 length:231 start_codon:yes stop_codon:yes gene_type:complete
MAYQLNLFGGEDYIGEVDARETWVCSICGKNTYDVDCDYIGSGTNHLGCELEQEMNDTPNDMEFGGKVRNLTINLN